MPHAASDPDFDNRRAARHRANFTTIMEQHGGEEIHAHVVNLSAHGFMIDNNASLKRGDRVTVRLPTIGRIESHCVWTMDNRAGFQLERILRLPDFMAMLDELQNR